jgi:aflatoxin B1 aldehyde reductase
VNYGWCVRKGERIGSSFAIGIPFQETLEAVNEMHKEGKFVRLGLVMFVDWRRCGTNISRLSNFTAFEVAEVVMICKANGWVRPTIWQGVYRIFPCSFQVLWFAGMYNAITRSIEQELIPACRRYGLDVVVYNPIAGGLFSGKFKLDEIPKEGRYSDTSRSGVMYRQRYFKDANFDALRIIEPVVQKNGLTMIETAFRWLVHHSQLKIKDGDDGIIIGVSSLDQLKNNLKDLEKGPLPDEVVKVLNQAWLIAKPTTANYWHLDLKYTYDTQKALFGQ